MTTKAAPAEQAKPKRKRRDPEYILQQTVPERGYVEILGAPTFADAAEAKKYITTEGLEGEFRIMKVIDVVTAKKETTTRIKLG